MTQTNLAAVIFDMDGLMLDTEPIYRIAWREAAAEQGFTLNDEAYFSFVGRSNADAEISLSELLGSQFKLPLFQQRWAAIWHSYVARNGVALKPGLLELLALLEQRQIRRAVATSASRPEVEICLRPVASRFEAIVTADEVPRGKPAPDLFLLSAQRLQVRPDACLVLEDSEAGVRAAVAAGMRAILVPDLQVPSPEVRRLAYRVCQSLLEVCEIVATEAEGPGPKADPALARDKGGRV